MFVSGVISIIFLLMNTENARFQEVISLVTILRNNIDFQMKQTHSAIFGHLRHSMRATIRTGCVIKTIVQAFLLFRHQFKRLFVM